MPIITTLVYRVYIVYLHLNIYQKTLSSVLISLQSAPLSSRGEIIDPCYQLPVLQMPRGMYV